MDPYIHVDELPTTATTQNSFILKSLVAQCHC